MTEVTTVVPAGSLTPQERTIAQAFGGAGVALRTSLPMGTLEERIRVAAMAADESDKLGNLIGKVLVITDVLMHPVTITSVNKDTGEITDSPTIRTVLITDQNEAIGCVSAGIANEITRLVAIFGALPWTPGLAVEVKQVNTRAGRRTYSLIPRITKPAVGTKK